MAVIHQDSMYGIIKLIPIKIQEDLSSLAVLSYGNYFYYIMLAGSELFKHLVSSDLQLIVEIKAK